MNLDDVRKAVAADCEFMQKHWHNPRIGPVDGEDAMREELLAVEQSVAASTLTDEAWEQYQLHWQAYIGEFSRANMRLSAHIMLAFEFEQRTNPEKLAQNPEAIRLLHWWLEECGKEDYLGKLPIADRRARWKSAPANGRRIFREQFAIATFWKPPRRQLSNFLVAFKFAAVE